MTNKSPEPQDGRDKEVFGPKFYIETGNPAQSSFGPEAFALKGTNDDNTNVIFAHHESNTTRLETQGEFLFTAGAKASKFSTAVNVISQSGDIKLISNQGGVHFKANEDIILEGKNIILKGVKIQIGDQFAHGTKELHLNATKIEVAGKKGNLPQHLKLSWGSGISFGPGAFVGQAISDKFFGK